MSNNSRVRSSEFGIRSKSRSDSALRTPHSALRIVLALSLAFSNTPIVFAKEFGVVEDIYVGRHTMSPFGGIGRYENLLRHSETFSDATWTKLSLGVSNGQAAPNGSTGASLLTNSASNGSASQDIAIAPAAATDYTFSVWLKAGTASTATVQLTPNGTAPTTDRSTRYTRGPNLFGRHCLQARKLSPECCRANLPLHHLRKYHRALCRQRRQKLCQQMRNPPSVPKAARPITTSCIYSPALQSHKRTHREKTKDA